MTFNPGVLRQCVETAREYMEECEPVGQQSITRMIAKKKTTWEQLTGEQQQALRDNYIKTFDTLIFHMKALRDDDGEWWKNLIE